MPLLIELPKKAPTYVALRRRAIFALIPLGIYLMLVCWGLVLTLNMQHIISDPNAIEKLATQIRNHEVFDIQNLVLTLLGNFTYIITAIAFILWMRQANRNLAALGSFEVKHRPSDVPWAFFIPVLNFYKPFLIMNEIWKASSPQSPSGNAWKHEKTSWLIISWWLFYLCMWITRWVGNSIELHLSDIQKITSQDLTLLMQVSSVDAIVQIVASILAIAVIWRITNMQAARHQVCG